MLTGKQRSFLRAQANQLEPIIHIGKDGVGDAVIKQIDQALDDHELLKARILNNSLEESKTAAQQLAEGLNAEIIQVIGNVFILFRRNEEEPVYILP